MTAMDPQRTIVIGIGTELRGDDGFGAAVIEALRGRPGLGGQVQLARCDGEPSRMIDLWEGYERAVVVDSVRGGDERFGFLYRRELATGGQIGASGRDLREPRGNAHAAGFGAAVRLAEVLGRLPGRLVLYAVHGRDFHLGAPLSPPVEAAVPELASRIAREIFAGVTAAPRRAEGPARPAPSGPGPMGLLRSSLST
jgi:hydrogenase maturation protease